MIYMDSAATTYHRPKQVTDAVIEAMNTMGNCSRGTHSAALVSARVIYETRELLCDFFNGDVPEQIVFTNNATMSLNLALKGILLSKDHVITTVLDHNSVLRPLYELEKQGVEVSIVGCTPSYGILVQEIEQAIRSTTKVVVCTHASNLTGNIVDIAAIGRICRTRGICFIVDASQTAGLIPIDVKKQFIDVLCFTGHKGLLGPQGTGGLWIREGVRIHPLVTGGTGSMTYSKNQPEYLPEALEAGTLNGHGIAGLRAAVLYLNEMGLDKIKATEQELAWEFYQKVNKIPFIQVYGDFSTKNRCPIVALNVKEYESGLISDELSQEYGIMTRSGGHCAPLMHERMGTYRQGAVRFSFSYFNTREEIEIAVNALKTIVQR